jgi:hypothetical protein
MIKRLAVLLMEIEINGRFRTALLRDLSTQPAEFKITIFWVVMQARDLVDRLQSFAETYCSIFRA